MSICLSMIVKNEASCIIRCLQSVKPYIDYWIICDTGSTDNTQNIIKDYLKDIPGELHQHEWVDFSTNRNKALELSKDKADYSLIIDADDFLVVENQDFKNLTALAYTIEIRLANIVYERTQLFKNNLSAHYVGVLHEYLKLPPGVSNTRLPGCHMQCERSGNRSKDPEKYKKDAELLEKALIKEPNNSRYVFYCAQSYRDSGQNEKAIEKYLQRAKMGGWIEEVYVSLLDAARLIEKINYEDIVAVESAYLRAHNVLPTRLEALCLLCMYCRKQNLFDQAYLYGKIGVNIVKPAVSLFMQEDCYTWRIKDELSVSSFYVGKRDESENLLKDLLNNKFVPKNDLERMENNLKIIQGAR